MKREYKIPRSNIQSMGFVPRGLYVLWTLHESILRCNIRLDSLQYGGGYSRVDTTFIYYIAGANWFQLQNYKILGDG